MAYYVAVQQKDGNYQGLDIKKSGYFDKTYTYEKLGECTLEEIDRYTTKFSSNLPLKMCLLSEEILFANDGIDPLVIYYYGQDDEGKVERKVQGHLLYKESKDFIENPSLVIEYISQRSQENDYTFFRQLAATLPANLTCAALVTRIACLLEKSAATGVRESELDATNILGDNIVTGTAKLLIYNNRIVPENGMVTYTGEINYEAFHNLVSFISDYQLSLTKGKKADSIIVPTVIDYVCKKTEEKDYIFFKQLAATLPENLEGISLISRISELLEKELISGDREPELTMINRVGENMVTEAIKMLICNSCTIPRTNDTAYVDEVNSETLDIVVDFIKDYEAALAENKTSGYERTKTKPENK